MNAKKKCIISIHLIQRKLNTIYLDKSFSEKIKLFILKQYEPNIDISKLKILKKQFGKPYLKYPKLNLNFNVSHCKNVYVMAVINSCNEIGIDIEKMEALGEDFESLVNFCLHPVEKQEFVTSKNPLRCFYKHWVLKEAVLKACGVGLNIDLKKILLRKKNENSYSIFFKQKWNVYFKEIMNSFFLALAYPSVIEPIILLKKIMNVYEK